MTHLFRINLPHSDMFIRSITDEHIEYEVRDGDGKLLEAPHKSKYNDGGDGKVYFDSRFVALPLFQYVANTLAIVN